MDTAVPGQPAGFPVLSIPESCCSPQPIRDPPADCVIHPRQIAKAFGFGYLWGMPATSMEQPWGPGHWGLRGLWQFPSLRDDVPRISGDKARGFPGARDTG